MELGNIIFGNSRGNFPIDRGGEFETALNWLFLNMDIDSHGEDFENDTFWIFPYYWGVCTCGYDEKEIVYLLSRYFSKLGYEIITASEGKEALEKTSRYKFDIILCDIKMPGMDGKSFYDKVTSINRDYAKCIIFMTGDIVSSNTRKFLIKTKNKYVQKPIDLKELEKIIAEIAGSY